MSELEIKKAKRKGVIFGLILSSPLIIIAGIFIYTILIHPLVQRSMTVEQLLCDRLNVWKNENETKSGIVAIRPVNDGTYEVWYNYFPVGIQEVDEEIAITIAEKLVRTFQDKDELIKLSIIISLPYRDAYLKREWRPYMSFELNRDTLAKYSYENFQYMDLYIICDNLKTYGKAE